jgi:hypothetical protein
MARQRGGDAHKAPLWRRVSRLWYFSRSLEIGEIWIWALEDLGQACKNSWIRWPPP